MSQLNATSLPNPLTTTSAVPRPMASASASTKMEHLVMLLLVCVSGNSMLMIRIGEPVLTATAYLLTILLLIYNRMTLRPRFVFAFGGFMVILMLQAMEFSFLPVVTILGFLVRLYIAYAAVCLIRDFMGTYVNVMFYVGILSLVFYVPENLLALAGVKLSSFFAPFAMAVGEERHLHIGLYNFTSTASQWPTRNSAFFWEPGAFAGFLLLALIFLTLQRKIMNPVAYKKRLILFSLCVLSTKSTTGYVVFPLALLLHFWSGFSSDRSTARRLLLAYAGVVVLAGVVCGFWQLGFVEYKIRQQVATVQSRQPGWQMTRYGSLLFDMEYIRRRPLLGWGLHDKTRFMLNPGTELGRKHGNGMSDFIAKFGLVGLSIFIICTSRGIYRISNNPGKTAVAILMILLILNGESFLSPALFLSVLFLDLPGPQISAAVPRHGSIAVGQ